MLEANQKPSDRIRKLQRLADLVLKTRLADRTLNQLILFVECVRVAAKLKELKIEQEDLAPSVFTVKQHFKHMASLFRPFLYLLAMILWGRNSKIALGVCVLLDLFSDVRLLESYLIRWPVFDKIVIRLVPGFLKSSVQSYQSYITYLL
jgi:energy-converting hydrogenase A subunit M